MCVLHCISSEAGQLYALSTIIKLHWDTLTYCFASGVESSLKSTSHESLRKFSPLRGAAGNFPQKIPTNLISSLAWASFGPFPAWLSLIPPGGTPFLKHLNHYFPKTWSLPPGSQRGEPRILHGTEPFTFAENGLWVVPWGLFPQGLPSGVPGSQGNGFNPGHTLNSRGQRTWAFGYTRTPPVQPNRPGKRSSWVPWAPEKAFGSTPPGFPFSLGTQSGPPPFPFGRQFNFPLPGQFGTPFAVFSALTPHRVAQFYFPPGPLGDTPFFGAPGPFIWFRRDTHGSFPHLSSPNSHGGLSL